MGRITRSREGRELAELLALRITEKLEALNPMQQYNPRPSTPHPYPIPIAPKPQNPRSKAYSRVTLIDTFTGTSKGTLLLRGSRDLVSRLISKATIVVSTYIPN